MAKKILIVDDDQEIVMLIAARLRANQYEIVVANDAVQAISKAHKEKPDLILLDNRMPAGSGLSVLATLRQTSDKILTPIIFITAYPSEKIKEEALEKGATDFIGKPFDANDLLGKIRKAFGEKDL
jgi:DNA-binding response OmpR family regulator